MGGIGSLGVRIRWSIGNLKNYNGFGIGSLGRLNGLGMVRPKQELVL